MTVFGTRPEIIRLSSLISRIDELQISNVLVDTNQNYEPKLNEVFFHDLGIRQPDYWFDIREAHFPEFLGMAIPKLSKVLETESPNGVLVLGDTNSALLSFLPERMGIPVFHMEAGNRAFDDRIPEELNRRIVDHSCSFNLPYSEHARQNLIAEGVHPSRIFKTGSPLREVISDQAPKIADSNVLDDLGVTPGNYFLASLHRQENLNSKRALDNIFNALNQICEGWKLPVLVSTHPRLSARHDLPELHEQITLCSPFNFSDYMRLQKDAKCVISDSGSISEEASILGFFAISPRERIERPEALEKGIVVACGSEPENIIRALRHTLKAKTFDAVEDYSGSDFSRRVVSFILSRLN